MLIEEVVELFIHSRKRGTTGARKKARPKTIEYYEETIAVFTDFLAERSKVSYEQIKKSDILEFLDWMDKQKGNQRHTKKLLWSKSTKLKILRALRALFRFVERDDECVEAGLKGWTKALPIIEATPSRKYIPQVEEIRKFKQAFDTNTRDGYRNYVAFCLMLDSGARCGEMVKLTVNGIKMTDEMMLVPDGKTGTRLVPLSTGMVKILKGWLRFRESWAKKSEYLFPSKYGTPLNPDALTHAFNKLRKKHGLAHITPHTMRHAFCTYFMKNGGDIAKMMMISGHSNYEVAKGYLHLGEVGGEQMKQTLEAASPLRNL